MKAIASGTIFGGLVDCYVLEDKTRVISKRGVSRALSGGSDAPEIKDLPRALGKLPSKYGQIATPRAIEFSRPTEAWPTGSSPSSSTTFSSPIPRLRTSARSLTRASFASLQTATDSFDNWGSTSRERPNDHH